MRFICTLVGLLFLLSVKTKADTGCLINTAAGLKVYYVPQFAGTTTFYQGGGTVRYGSLVSCQSGGSPTNSYYTLTSAPGAACYASYTGGSQTSPANYSQSGNIVSFTVGNCPIDDYIWIVAVAIGSLGFYFIKQRKRILLFPARS